MQPIPVRLKKDLSRNVRAGHPWIYRDAITPPACPTGSVVDVLGLDGRFLGRGLYDAGSPLAVRIYTLDAREPLDEHLVRRRLKDSLQARRGAIDPAETDAFRLCNGEGDLLPGVVVDLYASVAVVRFDGDAARALSDAVTDAVEALTRPLGVDCIVEKSRSGVRALRGVDLPSIVEIREGGVRLAVDIRHGQKTGTFLDQRDNRRAIRPYSAGATVANLFCYTGGFSVHAALAGARHVTSVDSAPAALEGARANFALNGIDAARHDFVCEDAFAWLERARAQGRRFDLLVVDPPSFAPSEKSLPRALGAYRDLFAASLALVERGGLLCASSCSSHVDMEDFLGTLRDASARAFRPLRLLDVRGQPADHPTTPAFKEGRYLKFVVCRG